jgi:PhnB protein
MSKVSTYLNFAGNTETAFNFYRKVFGGEFSGGGILRFGNIPSQPGSPDLPEEVKNMVMHMELAILNNTHTLMGSDAPEQLGFTVQHGNGSHIMLQTDTREETKQIFQALSVGGKIEQELQEMFWGAYYGSLRDQFGIQWMFNCEEKV